MYAKLRRDTRHIGLARALHARLLITRDGRVLSVRGKPSFSRLRDFLSRDDLSFAVGNLTSPEALGFATCDGELTRSLLQQADVALHRWRGELDAEADRRPSQRRRPAELARVRGEVQWLELRLRELWRRVHEFDRGIAPEGVLFLDSATTNRWRTAMEGRSTRLAEQARVVLWVAGETALRRFLEANDRRQRAYSHPSRFEPLQAFCESLLVWQRRAESESPTGLQAELTDRILSLPKFLRELGISAKTRGRSFVEHCQHLHRRARQLLTEVDIQRNRSAPAALAALVCTDGARVSLPRYCFAAGAIWDNGAKLDSRVKELAELSGQKGYDAALSAIDELAGGSVDLDFTRLRCLLAAGESSTDIRWAAENRLIDYFPRPKLRIPRVRRISEALAGIQMPIKPGYWSLFLTGLEQMADPNVILDWVAWAGSVSARARSGRLLERLHRSFWQTLLPASKLGWRGLLEPLLRPAPRDGALIPRLLEVQQTLGRTELPKSLRKAWQIIERRRGEAAYLKHAGELSPSARRRLDSLAHMPRLNPAKLQRTAEEAFLILGCEAQRRTAVRRAEDICREHLGDVAGQLTPDEFWSYAGWLSAMTPEERERTRELLAARARFGPDYRRRLPANADWIARAKRRGLNLDRWFDLATERMTLGGAALELGLCGDPAEIFRMGSYFGTCLGQGEVNQMSVITNAFDANKQVLFLFARDASGRRTAVGRQLLAVSDNDELLGYRVYLSWRNIEKSKRDEGAKAIAEFGGRLAARCGLPLADQGRPEAIGKHFWYDDGTVEWPAAARGAWEAERLRLPPAVTAAEREAPAVCSA